MKKRPISAKKKTADLSGWNENTRTAKYFDKDIDPKSKKDYDKLISDNGRVNHRPISATAQNNIVVEKDFENGKFEIGFMKGNGQVGSKFQVYRDIDQLNEDTHKTNYAATGYSLKKQSPKKVLVPATA